ncbi:MAG: hypothetical protein QM578_11750 [Pantoea sp.]|uniref:hypothetical protein n=1 Tax=Pantoea sp. TaxID=69393 RepID=UPI0039E2E368
MAQIHNQEIVNRLCQLPSSIEQIDWLYRKAYYRKRKDVNFLIVCNLLANILNSEISTDEEKMLAFVILSERFDKMTKDAEYCHQNFILVGDFEQALLTYRMTHPEWPTLTPSTIFGT